MHLLLLAAGVLAIAAGVVGLLFGAANYSPGVGNILILVGAVAVVGGAVLVGLGAILSRLRRIHDSLESQMVPRAIMPAASTGAPGLAASFSPALRSEPAVEAEPAPLAADSVSWPRDAQRSEPVGEVRGHSPENAPVPPVPPVRPVEAAPSPASASSPEPSAPPPPEKLRVQPPAAAAAPMSETIVVRADGSVTTEIEPRHAQAPAVRAPAARESGAAALALAGSGPPTILKSGVVEGMAYTLYDDGSIEAEMPDGTIRFNSVAELRAHLRERAQPAG